MARTTTKISPAARISVEDILKHPWMLSTESIPLPQSPANVSTSSPPGGLPNPVSAPQTTVHHHPRTLAHARAASILGDMAPLAPASPVNPNGEQAGQTPAVANARPPAAPTMQVVQVTAPIFTGNSGSNDSAEPRNYSLDSQASLTSSMEL